MLKAIKVTVEILCPVCNQEFSHTAELQINSTMQEFKAGIYSAIGHSRDLYENCYAFPCMHCNTSFHNDLRPMEIHCYPTPIL